MKMNEKFGVITAYIAISMLSLIAFLFGCTIILCLLFAIRSLI